MLTWQVLRSIYPTHTYHMEDNPAYRDIVATRNVIAKARRAWCLRSLLARLLGHGIFRLPQVLSLPPRYFGCMVLVGAILKLLARDSQRWRGRARSRRPVPKPTDSNPTLNKTCLPLVCRSWGSRPLSRREENSGLPLTTTRTRAYRSDPLPLPRLSSPKPPGGRSRRHPARHERPICRASDPVSIIFRELSVPRTYIAYRSVCSLRYGACEHAG